MGRHLGSKVFATKQEGHDWRTVWNDRGQCSGWLGLLREDSAADSKPGDQFTM